MSELKIGWAKRNITPPWSFSLCGQLYRRYPKQEVDTPLFATALVLEKDGEQAVFVSHDLTMTSSDYYAALHEELEKRKIPGLDVKKVMTNATHTHSAPFCAADYDDIDYDAYGAFLPKGARFDIPEIPEGAKGGPDNMAYVARQAADAVEEAWNKREPGYFGNALGRLPIAYNRRVIYKDGHGLMYGPTDVEEFDHIEGDTETGFELVYTFDKEKKLTGILANTPCPSQVMEHSEFISADYWGRVRELMAEEYGEDVFVLPLLAAAGDLGTRDMVRVEAVHNYIEDPTAVKSNSGVKRLTDVYTYADDREAAVKATKRIARRIVNEFRFCEEEARERMQEDAVLRHSVKEHHLPLRRISLFKAMKSGIRFLKIRNGWKNKLLTTEDVAQVYPYAGDLMRFLDQRKRKTVDDVYHVVRLGDIAFATNPYELFHDFGARIKARSRAPQTILIQLSCGWRGYLPTERTVKSGHYSAYIACGHAGPKGGDMLVEETLKTIEECYKA